MAEALQVCLFDLKKTLGHMAVQRVAFHPVFTYPLPVDNDKFDEFMTLVHACSPEDLAANQADIDYVYHRLLDSGFVDAYLGIYFDVHNVSSYATVVSSMMYAFDKTWRGTSCTVERNWLVETFLYRAANILHLRQLCKEDISEKENERYFSFTSVIDDVVRHVQSLNPTMRCNNYRIGTSCIS